MPPLVVNAKLVLPLVLMTSETELLVAAALLASPAYAAAIVCVPVLSVLVVQTAVRVLPLPDIAAAEQPLIVVPSDVKLTLPVGAMAVMLAVKVTDAPADAGLDELVSAAVLVALLTSCDR